MAEITYWMDRSFGGWDDVQSVVVGCYTCGGRYASRAEGVAEDWIVAHHADYHRVQIPKAGVRSVLRNGVRQIGEHRTTEAQETGKARRASVASLILQTGNAWTNQQVFEEFEDHYTARRQVRDDLMALVQAGVIHQTEDLYHAPDSGEAVRAAQEQAQAEREERRKAYKAEAKRTAEANLVAEAQRNGHAAKASVAKRREDLVSTIASYSDGITTPDLAERVGGRYSTLRKDLAVLVRVGRLQRHGTAKDSVYILPGKPAATPIERRRRRVCEAVAAHPEGATFAGLCQALPDASRDVLRRDLAHMMEAGTLEYRGRKSHGRYFAPEVAA